MKQCTICDGVKPLDCFTRMAKSKDGHYPQCTECKNDIQRRQAEARVAKRLAGRYQTPAELTCTGCGETKPTDEFGSHRTNKTGRKAKCLRCLNEVGKEIARANTERYNAGLCSTPEFKTCTACNERKPASAFSMRKVSKDGLEFRCRECNKVAQREARILLRYGITVAQRDAMLAAQGGCANCGGTEHRGQNWQVDHDHSCCPGAKTCGNCIAGILCSPCNLAIGLLRDDPDLIIRTAAYVKRTRRHLRAV